ncbi:MAG: galactose-1-phosphate uridylyltransferase [Deltaproteobacteria bacterium]|nr:galactose-1-phosphate uridylyltransferase [Deltaproteobacteria bacterium]
MSELRLNPVTREWVIIARERAKRPDDFKGMMPLRRPLPGYLKGCPFCAGHEDKTPPESMRVGDGKGWRLRVIPNKFSALTEEGEKKRTREGVKRSITGVGRHEVIIETPRHNMNPALREPAEVEDIIAIYRARFIDAHRDPRVEHVIIFKNHGEGAGTSLEHPHSQLIATPVVPVQFRDRLLASMHYFDDTGRCLICDVLTTEVKDSSRVILDSEHFTTFIPYAALSPFHTWIFPKRHSASFSDITGAETKDIAVHLKNLLSRVYHGLNNPDYNYVIRSSRPMDAGNEYCHWYMAVVPRLTKTAGFELGSGMFINTSVPEDDAEFLRSVNVPEN